MPLLSGQVATAGLVAAAVGGNLSVLREEKGLKATLYRRSGQVVGLDGILGWKHVDAEVHGGLRLLGTVPKRSWIKSGLLIIGITSFHHNHRRCVWQGIFILDGAAPPFAASPSAHSGQASRTTGKMGHWSFDRIWTNGL